MDHKTTVKYHYLKGVVNYANGSSNIEESSIALENLNKAIDLGINDGIYHKVMTKNKVPESMFLSSIDRK